MLKHLALPTLIVLLGALPVAGDSSCGDPDDLSWLFDTPARASIDGPDVPPPTVALASTASSPDQKPGESLTCMVSEDCNELPNISCSGTTCSAVSRNCDIDQRGHVTCDGNTTQCSQPCPDPPPSCTFQECRAPCQAPGCFASCVNFETCECETICP